MNIIIVVWIVSIMIDGYDSINIFVYFVLLVVVIYMSESILPSIVTPNSKRKRLVLTDISSNFVYYATYNRSMMIPKILKSSRNVLDASSY
jgi:hypothetical protein